MSDADLQSSQQLAKTQKPRDAATLIIVRRDGTTPRALLGRRHGGHAFMPNMYVFPGGRLDPADGRMTAAAGLPDAIEQRLLSRMRGGPRLARARGLAMAAVRETFEEVGLIIGRKSDSIGPAPSEEWRSFVRTGYLPDLSALRFVMRAITPPGRTRRFDTRFFIVDAAAVANLECPVHHGSGELLETQWLSFEDAAALELPRITRDVLERLAVVIGGGGWPQVSDPVPFQYQRHGRWHEDIL
jgi:8-oxo-dGTP pyrophosphatase MutT (NUDIX family)